MPVVMLYLGFFLLQKEGKAWGRGKKGGKKYAESYCIYHDVRVCVKVLCRVGRGWGIEKEGEKNNKNIFDLESNMTKKKQCDNWQKKPREGEKRNGKVFGLARSDDDVMMCVKTTGKTKE